jgi:hypothetical protein
MKPAKRLVAIAATGIMMSAGLASLVLTPTAHAVATQPHFVPLNCPSGDHRTPTEASPQPLVVLTLNNPGYPPSYEVNSVDNLGGDDVVKAPTTDHLVAAWQNSTNCSGYYGNIWVVDTSGVVTGDTSQPAPPALNFGDMAGHALNLPVVGMSPTSDGIGYWLVASDGGIFAFGDAAFFGSMGGTPLNKAIVGMTGTPDKGGYWMVATDGGIFSFGDAAFFGSMGGTPLNQPIVGMTATPDGGGYWMVASDGGVFCFGDAAFHGSLGGSQIGAPIAGMRPYGNGYTLIGQYGHVYPFP